MLVDSLPLIWVDAILMFTLCEWLILSYRSRKTQSGLSVGDISFGLLPGFLLMLALRFAARCLFPVAVLQLRAVYRE